MEKQYKPVPNVEALRYKGTEEKPDIKIFVSHRIDLDSVVVDNPLYVPVRCGATYDPNNNTGKLGDDTGDNISEERMTFCEFTVMYWAWKNVKADYYGLQHYRRYLSFAEKEFPGPGLRQGFHDSMSHSTLEECGLLNSEKMRDEINKYDMIIPCEYSLRDIPGNYATMREYWLNAHIAFLQDNHFDLVVSLIKKHAPQYLETAIEYMNGVKFVGFNCFIMKREIFNEMCEFMFPIMFEFDSKIDKDHFSSTQNRAVGYLGEWLFSIFLCHCQKKGIYKCKQTQLITFQNTEKEYVLTPAFDTQNIPIMLTVTDTNRPLLAIQIQSILEHTTRAFNYDIILIRRSYDEDKWGTYLRKLEDQQLKTLVKDYTNVSLRFYDPKDDIDSVEIHKWGTPSKEEQYYLLLAPWILKNYEKVICLQDNMLVVSDLSELFQCDVSHYYAAAVKSIYFSAMLNGYAQDFKEKCRKKLKVDDVYNYVSTDVAVLNLSEIRQNLSKAFVLDTLKKRNFDNIIGDGFNVLFEKKIRFLSQKWNKIECFGPEYFSLLEYFPAEEFKQQSECGKILNLKGMSGQLLPQQSDTMRRFWYYAQKTGFYEQILFSLVPNWSLPIFDLQCRVGVFDNRTGIRKFADKIMPPGSKLRSLAKKIMPRGSFLWKLGKQIYFIFKPEYRPVKPTVIDEDDE